MFLVLINVGQKQRETNQQSKKVIWVYTKKKN